MTAKARAERPCLTVEWLPRYAPELNDIELAWRDLKLHHLAHRTFSDAQQLEATIRSSIAVINRERMKAQHVTTYKSLLSMDGGGPVSEGEVESELVELFGVRCWARRCRGGPGNLDRCVEWSFCLTAARMVAEQERR